MYRKQSGMNLIELMVILVILGILASFAMPAYNTFMKRARFGEILMSTGAHKTAIEAAIQMGTAKNLTDLNPGQFGIPPNVTVGATYLDKITVENGVITAQGNDFVDNATFVLTPSSNDEGRVIPPIVWAQSGTCFEMGLC